jgi:hypothetical protein
MLVTVEARHNAVVVGYEFRQDYNNTNISERQILLLRWTQVKESWRQKSNCTALSHTGCFEKISDDDNWFFCWNSNTGWYCLHHRPPPVIATTNILQLNYLYCHVIGNYGLSIVVRIGDGINTSFRPVAFPGILFWGGSINSVEDRERGSGGGSPYPLVMRSGGSCNLVQEISFHIVKVS